MRRVAACVVLLAAGGCNQVYGIDPTTPIDGAGPGLDAPPAERMLRVTYQQTAMDPDGNELPLQYPPLRGPVTVRVGRLGGEMVNATSLEGGAFTFVLDPVPAAGETLHASITAPEAGIVTTELYWVVGMTAAHVVVPIIGRQAVSPTEVPVDSGWTVDVSGSPLPMFSRMLALTSGSWTQGIRGAATRPWEWPFATNAVPLAGTRAVPDATKGDQVMLLDMPFPAQSCVLSSRGAITFAPPPLHAGSPTPVPGAQPSFDNDVTTWRPTWTPLPVTTGFIAQLGALGEEPTDASFRITDSGRFAFGYLPTASIPAFTRFELDYGNPRKPRALPVPPMLTVSECPLDMSVSNPFAPVDWLEAHTVGTGHLQLTSTRTIASSGIALTSGLDVAVITSGSALELHVADFTVVPLAPMPATIELVRGADTHDLVDGADGGLVAGTGDLEVRWTTNPMNSGVSDYWSVTLVALGGAVHSPVRVAMTTKTTVTMPLDGVPSGEYTLELRAHTGYPGAGNGDFAIVALPQSMTTVSTRTFRL